MNLTALQTEFNLVREMYHKSSQLSEEASESLHDGLEALEEEVERLKVDHIDGLSGWEESQAVGITNKEANELILEIKKFRESIFIE